jgi:hypothetical protein
VEFRRGFEAAELLAAGDEWRVPEHHLAPVPRETVNGGIERSREFLRLPDVSAD